MSALPEHLVEVFANEQFVVMHKTGAMSFHTEDNVPGLFEQAKALLELTELYPVHRLDKLTTGLVIFAKTKSCAAQFGKLFEQRQIAKFYLAISDQKPKKKQGWIKGDMAKARRGAYKLLRTLDNPAITRFISSVVDAGSRLFLVSPRSGKTHQIRVALKSIGSPILGDELYCPKSNIKGADNQVKSADRGYLHAYALRFELSGESFEFVVPPTTGQLFCSENLVAQLSNQWAKPWELFNNA
ncbi:MAG: TIGR01621 family pseudouridine synthase [Psychrosphaera sp.]|nr:TIGR01621 family pseudouridine synthase [Psychrosphaera sp.]